MPKNYGLELVSNGEKQHTLTLYSITETFCFEDIHMIRT